MKICKTASTKVTQKLARALLKSFQASARTKTKPLAFLYADMLGRGLGVEKDLVRSYEIFKSLCENGSKRACNVLELVPKN